MNMRVVLCAVVLSVFPLCTASAADDVCPSLVLVPGKTHLVLKEGAAELPRFALHCPHDTLSGTGHIIGDGVIKNQSKTTTAFVDATYFFSLRDPGGKEVERHEFPTQIDFCATCHPDGSNDQKETFDYTVPLRDGLKLGDCKLEMGWILKKN